MAWSWKKRYSDKNGDTVISSTSHLPPLASFNAADRGGVSDPSEAWKQQASSGVALEEAEAKQHAKVAEEAVAGWEKAEAETESVKRQLDLVLKEKAALQDRLSHLDAALKDCTRQVRLVREDQEQKRQELLQKKNKEVEKIRAEYEAKLADVGRQLLEAGAENKVMAMTLHEHARTIGEVTDAKSRSEAESTLLQHRLEALEKDKAALKYEVHVLNKQLQIRNEERDYSKRDIDVLNKKHIEDTKLVNKLEGECQKLRNLVRRKLPGPNALAQMKMEVDSLDGGGESKRRGRSPATDIVHSPHKLNQNGNREIELLLERLLSMEEETKMLKEALAQRNGELQSSRLLCAKTATKLSAMEAYFDSLTRTHGLSKGRVNDAGVDGSPSVVSMPENGTNDDGVSRADAWASALIAELSQFRKDKPSTISSISEAISSPSTFGIMDDFTDMEKLASDLTSSVEKNPAIGLDDDATAEVPAKRVMESDSERMHAEKEEADTFDMQASMRRGITLLESLVQSLGLGPVAKSHDVLKDSEASENELHGKLQKLSSLLSLEARPALQAFVHELLSALEAVLVAVSRRKQEKRAVEVLDCETQTVDGNDKVELELVRIEKSALETHMRSELSRLTAMEAELVQLRNEKAELQQGLDAGDQHLQVSKAQLQEAQHLIDELQTKLSLSFPDESKDKEEAMVMSEVEVQARSSGSLMQDAVSRLEKELEEEYKNHEADKTRRTWKEAHSAEVQQQQQQQEAGETEDDRRTRKDQEIVEAEAKLAECQRTILALGKQLKNLSLSPHETSAMSSEGSRANSMLSMVRNFSESEADDTDLLPSGKVRRSLEDEFNRSSGPPPRVRDVSVNECYIASPSQEHDRDQDFSSASPVTQRGGSSSPATKARRSSFSRFFRAKNSG